mmetsp:Transcript_55893/g.154789  ORF Transcript_55893/g.154789 Transcript_55893/m.154789 type:complete len:281 (+) Transcript_55893:313-1155(+)
MPNSQNRKAGTLLEVFPAQARRCPARSRHRRATRPVRGPAGLHACWHCPQLISRAAHWYPHERATHTSAHPDDRMQASSLSPCGSALFLHELVVLGDQAGASCLHRAPCPHPWAAPPCSPGLRGQRLRGGCPRPCNGVIDIQDVECEGGDHQRWRGLRELWHCRGLCGRRRCIRRTRCHWGQGRRFRGRVGHLRFLAVVRLAVVLTLKRCRQTPQRHFAQKSRRSQRRRPPRRVSCLLDIDQGDPAHRACNQATHTPLHGEVCHLDDLHNPAGTQLLHLR